MIFKRNIEILLEIKKKVDFSIVAVSDLLERKKISKEWLVGEFLKLSQEVWGDIQGGQYVWQREMIESHFSICPDYVLCAFKDGRLAATLTTMLTNEEEIKKGGSWLDRTGGGFLTGHNPDGDVLFGADLSVSRSVPLNFSTLVTRSSLLYIIVGRNLKANFIGSRIPGYRRKSHMKVKDYVYGKKSKGNPIDPHIAFHTRNGFKLVKILPDYMEDPDSLNYGVLMRWDNPFYHPAPSLSFLNGPSVLTGKDFLAEASIN